MKKPRIGAFLSALVFAGVLVSGVARADGTVPLTPAEAAWLAAHKDSKIRVMVSPWPPFHYVEKGEAKGLSVAYVKKVLDRLGLGYEFKPISWDEALDGISRLEKIDLMLAIVHTSEREKLMKFTDGYLQYPSVIFTRKDSPFVGSLHDLHGRSVAVEKDFIAHRRLLRDHPQIKLHVVATSRQAIQAVSLGKADAYVANLVVGSYLIEKYGFANVKVAAPSGYPDDVLAMGVRKDWPELVGMIDKALAAITDEEQSALRKQALTVRYEFGVDIKKIVIWAAAIGTVVVVVFAVVIAWSRRLGREVAERKKAQAELVVAKEQAEAATVAKAAFLATMSHEIRTPMNGVIGMIDMLTQTKLDDDQRHMVRTVRDSAYALLTIINDILDFSKIEAGKLVLEAIPVSIRDIVEGVAETLAPTANKKGIRINIHVDPDIPDAVLGDQVRIRQILFNIAGNAVKFTDKGRVLMCAFMASPKDGQTATVRFEIADTGIGIPKEAQAELFKEFSQAESSTTRRFGGTGLGLSICQRLTAMMNGTIDVKSVPGQGSTFTVTLTFPVPVDHAIKSDGIDLKGLNILLLCGDAEVRPLDAKYLGHWNAEVAVCGDLEEARSMALAAAARNRPFDVVVMGSDWPEETRAQAVAALREASAPRGMTFVLMTMTRAKAARAELADTIYVESDPLRRAAFVRGVAAAAGRASPVIEHDEELIDLGAGKAPTVEEALAAGTLILVAEDNPTNRDVIGRQLKLLGYAAEMAEDGALALQAWRDRRHAILLTDCHMPNMDGYELARRIRKAEKDGRRTPIVAITANVMQGEIDRCLEAGMDDYLPKPLDMRKLKESLRKWMPGDKAGAKAAPAPKPGGGAPAAKAGKAADIDAGVSIDPSALKSVFGDDPATFKEILRDFVGHAATNVDEIEAAFAKRSANGVAKAAHKLKSSARSVGANELADLCLALETAGKADNWARIETSAPRLSGSLRAVTDYVKSL